MTDNTHPIEQNSKGAAAANEAGRDLADKAKSEARTLRDSAVSEVESRAEGAKQGLAREVSSVGSALRKASEDLRSGSPQEQIFATAASSLADMADGIEGQDLGQLLKNAGDFAKRNPIAFLGGAALLGFAGARLAKASKSTHAAGQDATSAGAGGTTPSYGTTGGYGTTSPSAASTSAANTSPGVTPGQSSPATPYGGPSKSEV